MGLTRCVADVVIKSGLEQKSVRGWSMRRAGFPAAEFAYYKRRCSQSEVKH